jgi:hypothetical protein
VTLVMHVLHMPQLLEVSLRTYNDLNKIWNIDLLGPLAKSLRI